MIRSMILFIILPFVRGSPCNTKVRWGDGLFCRHDDPELIVVDDVAVGAGIGSEGSFYRFGDFIVAVEIDYCTLHSEFISANSNKYPCVLVRRNTPTRRKFDKD